MSRRPGRSPVRRGARPALVPGLEHDRVEVAPRERSPRRARPDTARPPAASSPVPAALRAGSRAQSRRPPALLERTDGYFGTRRPRELRWKRPSATTARDGWRWSVPEDRSVVARTSTVSWCCCCPRPRPRRPGERAKVLAEDRRLSRARPRSSRRLSTGARHHHHDRLRRPEVTAAPATPPQGEQRRGAGPSGSQRLKTR